MSATDILDLAADKRLRGEPFALATVVRTVSVTAAKAGAKALISSDGQITGGWIGGGCARGAVLRAARAALGDGQPRLVSIQPEDLLSEQGVAPGEEKAGVTFARNMCPSQGTMDVFVEPVLPRPSLFVLGSSPVAVALAELAPQAGFMVTVAAPAADHARFAAPDRRIDGLALPPDTPADAYVVVSTQGAGDSAALKAALSLPTRHVAFVGSRRKAAALRAQLEEDGVDPQRLAAVKAPAGLDIGAITTEEIAFSILSELIALRRRASRRDAAPPSS
jgi:xanthine dehydrogenase accessory factor